MSTLYQLLRDDPSNDLFDEGTPYEAVVSIRDDNDGRWSGFLVFKNERYSPPDPDVPGIQFKFYIPPASSGVQASIRAENYWRDLVSLFQSLEKESVHS